MGKQGTIDDWRKDLLEVLENIIEGSDVQKVEWSTAGDENVCSLCAARDGKIYSIQEVKKELAGEFCKPGDSADRCRCTLLYVSFRGE